MRRAGTLIIPITIVLIYYAVWIMIAYYLVTRFPVIAQYFPIGGIEDLAASNLDGFEPVYTRAERTILAPNGPVQLAIASLGAIVLTIPISWVYFITSRQSRIQQSFMQTIMILPVVVTGISMIVANSMALAFSLAGVVAAVRFRFSLSQPSDAMYIFVAIAIGLGAGIGAIGVALVTSATFVFATLVIWKLEYGKTLAGPFLTMLTRRDGGEDDY